MPISVMERLGMWIRRIPVGRMRRAVQLVDQEGLPISSAALEVHFLVGGDVERALEAYLLARGEGTEVDWQTLTALDLNGVDPVESVRAATKDRVLDFESYSPGGEERILGFTRAGAPLKASCKVTYRRPLVAADELLERTQERLATRIAIIINTAEDLNALQRRLEHHEQALLFLAQSILPTAKRVEVEFARAE